MDAESFRRLGAYLSQHAETCPRARRERLEWLGDAVLRDPVARPAAAPRAPQRGRPPQPPRAQPGEGGVCTYSGAAPRGWRSQEPI